MVFQPMRLSAQEENYSSRIFRFLCEPDFLTNSKFPLLVCSQNVPSNFTKCLGNYFQCDEPKLHIELAFHLFLVEISQSTQIPGLKSWQISKHQSWQVSPPLFQIVESQNQLENPILQ